MGILLIFSISLAIAMAITIAISWRRMTKYLKLSTLLLLSLPFIYCLLHHSALVVILDSLITMVAIVSIYVGILR